MNQSTWQANFKQWQDFAARINARATAVTNSKHDRAWKLAASVGIGHCGCSLHNASIDDSMTGWCAGNPNRLKVAKRARHMLDDWKASRLAERIISRKYESLMKS